MAEKFRSLMKNINLYNQETQAQLEKLRNPHRDTL